MSKLNALVCLVMSMALMACDTASSADAGAGAGGKADDSDREPEYATRVSVVAGAAEELAAALAGPFTSSDESLRIVCAGGPPARCDLDTDAELLIIDGTQHTSLEVRIEGAAAADFYAAFGVPEMLVDAVPSDDPVLGSKRLRSADGMLSIQCFSRAANPDCKFRARAID